MNNLPETKKRFYPIIEGYVNFLERKGSKDELKKYFITQREVIKRDRYQIALIGHVSRGKSTLLNALLGQKGNYDLAPVDNEATTAAIVKYIDSELNQEAKGKEEAVIKFNNGNIKRIDRSELNKFINWEAPGFSESKTEEIEYIEVYGNFPLIETRGVFVDTPGRGALHNQDQLTLDILPMVDVILCPISVDLPLELDERRFLKNLRKDDKNKLMYVVTKIDDCDEDEQDELNKIISDVEKIASETGGGMGVFPTAAKKVLDLYENYESSEDTIKKAKQKWGMQDLENALDDKLRKESNAADRIREVGKALEENINSDLGRLNENLNDFKLKSADLGKKKEVLETTISNLKTSFDKNFKKLEREWKKTVIRFTRRLESKGGVIADSIIHGFENKNLFYLIGKSSQFSRDIQKKLNGMIEPELLDLQDQLIDVIEKFAKELENDYNDDIAIYSTAFPQNSLKNEIGAFVGSGIAVGGAVAGASLIGTGVLPIATAISGLSSAAVTAAGASPIGAWFLGLFGAGANAGLAAAQATLLGALATGLLPIIGGIVCVIITYNLGSKFAKDKTVSNIPVMVEAQIKAAVESIKETSEKMLKAVLSDFKPRIDALLDGKIDELEIIINDVKALGGEKRRKDIEQDINELEDFSNRLKPLLNEIRAGF
ncbi:MAG: dynamin family protein [Treponema sp.]|jgi:GTPase Era involved in 16S rRNA processing|nr:dynamin family protein [Treponema sp.]